MLTKEAAAQDDNNAAADWRAAAARRVTDNPALEAMARRSFDAPFSAEAIWAAIAPVTHWQADAFHNEIVRAHDAGGVGGYFEMRHTNYPIIPWPMADQQFIGVITGFEPGRRQVLAELNVSDEQSFKRTPDHQQTIELEPLGSDRTRVFYSVATIRVAGISPLVRFFFRPWARLQLWRAIGKKYRAILGDVRASATLRPSL